MHLFLCKWADLLLKQLLTSLLSHTLHTVSERLCNLLTLLLTYWLTAVTRLYIYVYPLFSVLKNPLKPFLRWLHCSVFIIALFKSLPSEAVPGCSSHGHVRHIQRHTKHVYKHRPEREVSVVPREMQSAAFCSGFRVVLLWYALKKFTLTSYMLWATNNCSAPVHFSSWLLMAAFTVFWLKNYSAPSRQGSVGWVFRPFRLRTPVCEVTTFSPSFSVTMVLPKISNLHR